MFLGKRNKLNHGGQKGWVFIEENYCHMLKESQYISQFLDIRPDSKIQDCGQSCCAFQGIIWFYFPLYWLGQIYECIQKIKISAAMNSWLSSGDNQTYHTSLYFLMQITTKRLFYVFLAQTSVCIGLFFCTPWFAHLMGTIYLEADTIRRYTKTITL